MEILTFMFFLIFPIFALSLCPSSYNYTCGIYTLEIQSPFFTDAYPSCKGLHYIQCTNLVPLISFSGESGFMFPIWNISYQESTLVIHDLRLSAYFRSSDCVFLYEFFVPIPNFTVSSVSQSLNSSQPFFDCRANSYDYSQDVFRLSYNRTECRDYNLYYSFGSEYRSGEDSMSYCLTSSDMWFDWKIKYGDDGELALKSAGFSRKWTPFPTCFGCERIGVNCTGNGSCECSGQCWGAIQSTNHHSWRIIIAAVVSVAGLLLASALCFFWYWRRRTQTRLRSSGLLDSSCSFTPRSMKELQCINLQFHTPLFSYEELIEATKGFDPKEELGDGGYGTVYRGTLRDGRIVAVKRLYETNHKRVEKFVNEVEILSRLRHPNLVTLYGCTSPSSPHLLLVYELVPNGTLADHLHLPSPHPSLPLHLRLSLAISTASALSYLHSHEIIHRDVKSHNILVDASFNAKLADFGLSRLFPVNSTHVSTAPQGTPGYLDPQYHQFYQLTEKSDVYSFGVVLMELLASRPAVVVDKCPNEISLAMLALKKIQKGELRDIVDPALGDDGGVVTRIGEVAFRCLQTEREMRPTMKEVLEELQEISRGCFRNCGSDGVTKDDVRLLTGLSPKSVVEKWTSRSTTSNVSK